MGVCPNAKCLRGIQPSSVSGMRPPEELKHFLPTHANRNLRLILLTLFTQSREFYVGQLCLLSQQGICASGAKCVRLAPRPSLTPKYGRQRETEHSNNTGADHFART